ncbi:MAG: OmpA family protein [Sneathiella sp.]
MRKITSLLALLPLIAGCGITEYEELSHADPKAGEFSNSLAKEYQAFAKSEIEQYDWPDQQYIAKKGLLAVNGKQPLPEEPVNWHIKAVDRSNFSDARANLIHWLNTDARHTSPQQSAKAQVSFDCWVEQKEENWQTDHIEACKNSMSKALPMMRSVFFPIDKATVDIGNKDTLREIALDWHNYPGKFILLQGHTDRSGSLTYNYALAKKRTAAVKESLIAFGIQEVAIQTELWGETRPRTELGDQKGGLSNRRVEILKF